DGQSSVFPSSPSMEQSLVRALTSVPLSTATRLPAYRSSAQRCEEKTAAFGAEIPHRRGSPWRVPSISTARRRNVYGTAGGRVRFLHDALHGLEGRTIGN